MQSDCQLVAFCAQPDCILTSSWLKPDCCLDAFWMKIVAEHRTLSMCRIATGGCAQPAARLGALGNQRRSRWATAPSTCSENMPCGVVVSIGSCRLRKCAPAASSCSMTSRRWLTERARRSSRTTTRVSPGRSRAAGEPELAACDHGGNPCVANQTAWRGFRQFCRHKFGSPRANLQISKTFLNGRLQKWPKAGPRRRAEHRRSGKGRGTWAGNARYDFGAI